MITMSLGIPNIKILTGSRSPPTRKTGDVLRHKHDDDEVSYSFMAWITHQHGEGDEHISTLLVPWSETRSAVLFNVLFRSQGCMPNDAGNECASSLSRSTDEK